jgi:hypothetical protein
VVVGVAAAALAGAAPAGARVLNAESILPPGQSGYVSLTGLTSGGGSPHAYDQQSPFIGFRRKPFGFHQPARSTERPFPGVTITRDAYGVPNVVGADDLAAWKGAGYAVAQDRLFQLEAFRHATRGERALVTGKGDVETDLVTHRDYYTRAELERQHDRLPVRFRQRLEAYRDGINAWITHVRTNPLDVPAEYVATTSSLAAWTVMDSLRIGVFLARTVPSGDGEELRNLRALQAEGMRPAVLDALLPVQPPRQVSTIPRSEGTFPQGRALSAKQVTAARDRSLAFAATLPGTPASLARATARKSELDPGEIGRVGGSSMLAVRAPGNRAFLFNGPQLGFSAPELFVELEVHAPGLDVRGVTAPGLPVIGIGHNGNVAWGITSGLSDEDDLYAEKLVPGEKEKYWYKGEVRSMDCRDVTIRWKDPVTTLLDGALPSIGSTRKRVCRTVHGPVQSVVGNVAYARRYAIWGRELETIEGLDLVNRARTIQDVDAAARRLTWNENLMAADSQGNIGYWHPGLVQLRPAGWDQRLPLPGTGEAEWEGLVPRERMPHVINPKRGWLSNWNNVPSQGWTTGDGPASERVTGPFHRDAYLARLAGALKALPSPTFADLQATIRRAGSVAQQRPLASARLRTASRGATGEAAKVLGVLTAWSGDYVATDARGTVDPGVATWEAFKTAAADLAVAPFAKGAKAFEDRPGTSHAFDITAKEAYALRTLSPAGYREAAATTAAAMTKRFGTPDPARWRAPREMYDMSAQGAQQPPPLPFFDRGTYEQLLEVGP